MNTAVKDKWNPAEILDSTGSYPEKTGILKSMLRQHRDDMQSMINRIRELDDVKQIGWVLDLYQRDLERNAWLDDYLDIRNLCKEK